MAEDGHHERKALEGQSHTPAETAGIDPGFAWPIMSEEWQVFVKAGNGKKLVVLDETTLSDY